MHCLHNYWFYYQNEQKNLSTSLFRRVQVQNKENIYTPRFINIELESDTESDVETDSESNTATEN